MFDCIKNLFDSQSIPKSEEAKQIATKPQDPPWLKVARLELGQREIKGSKHNPRVLQYHSKTSLKATDDETAWCSAFINWCFDLCQIDGTNKANARSWLNWGTELESPVLGCVVVFWRSSKTSWQGHVALYLYEDKNYLYVLGGNQGDSVSVAKYPKSRVLGYRWPKF